MSTTLGIIGTAGRKDDAAKLTSNDWRTMVCVSQIVATLVGATKLVSGGAAWADHCAVTLYNRGFVKKLTLHLPTLFDPDNAVFANTDAGRVSNNYHAAFSAKVFSHAPPGTSLCQIADAMEKGCHTTQSGAFKGFGSFFERNSMVAEEAHVMLAFTFGVEGESVLKDGGTKDTMAKFLKRRELPPGEYRGIPIQWPAYHFNLTDRVLYPL